MVILGIPNRPEQIRLSYVVSKTLRDFWEDEKGNLVEMDSWYRMVIMPYYAPKWPLVTGSETKLCRNSPCPVWVWSGWICVIFLAVSSSFKGPGHFVRPSVVELDQNSLDCRITSCHGT